jgi:hypothetical protein
MDCTCGGVNDGLPDAPGTSKTSDTLKKITPMLIPAAVGGLIGFFIGKKKKKSKR